MGVLLYAVFIGSVNLKCLFLKHAEKALAETAALLVLRKKADAIWGDPEDE